MLAPDVFWFLNVERRCATPAQWHPADAAKLWTYNLHYFDDLNARDAAARLGWHENLIERWHLENPPGLHDAWEPYPVSRRIVNWVKWAARGNTLSQAARDSLAVQARWLARRVEYHIMGNHLIANAKALIYAGLFFAGDEADGWLRQGADLLEVQLHEQVLADGAHFELSPMYHALVLEDLLDVLNLLQAYGRTPTAQLRSTIASMQRWMAVMIHPDGDIAFFNDAALEIAPRRDELEAYATRLGLPAVAEPTQSLTVLGESGYLRAVAGDACLLCDCAAIGPDYLPGHAHADTLSFEFSLGRQRLFVNSGTSEYGNGLERQRQRGTAAHNTLVVDGHDSSEVWAGFRVARRARVHLHEATQQQCIVVRASHMGYRRLPGGNEHQRRWVLGERSLLIEDRVTGTFRNAAAFFHLHPAVQAAMLGPQMVGLTLPDGTSATMTFDAAAAVELRPGTWHPQFGLVVDNYCVVASSQRPLLSTSIQWGAP